MSRFIPRKAKQVSIPEPMTSVIQEIKGVKRKVTPKPVVISTAVKRTKILSTPHFGKSALTSIKEISPNAEIAKDVTSTKTMDQTNSETRVLEKPSSCILGTAAKGKKILLDPVELQSITKLQNWVPPLRATVNDVKTDKKIQQKYASQMDGLDYKSNLLTKQLTQRTPTVWQPPLRRSIPATITASTPAKRAKICESDKAEKISEDKSIEGFHSVAEGKEDTLKIWKTPNQLQKLTVSQDGSTLQKPTNATLPIEEKNSQVIGTKDLIERSQKSNKSHEISIPPVEILESNDNCLSYSPIEIDNQEIQNEDPLEGTLMEESKLESNSQDSEEDIFLSQESIDKDKLVPEILSEDPFNENLVNEMSKEKTMSQNRAENIDIEKNKNSKEKDIFEPDILSNDTLCENLPTEVMKLKTTGQNSDGGICVETVISQKLSCKDLFQSQIQSERPFDENLPAEEFQPKTLRHTSVEDVFVQKGKNEEEIAEEDMFNSQEDNIPLQNLEKLDHEGMQSKILSKSPTIDGFNVDAVTDTILLTPPSHFELDISSCPTVKRIFTEMPATELKMPIGEEPPDVSHEASSTLDNVVNSTVVLEKEVNSDSMCEMPYAFDDMNSSVVSVALDSTRIINLKLNTEALENTNKVSEKVEVKVGDLDEAGFTVENQLSQEDERAMSLNLIKVPDDTEKETVSLLNRNSTINLSGNTTVKGKEGNLESLHFTEDNNTKDNAGAEKLQLQDCTNVIEDDSNMATKYVKDETNFEMRRETENSALVEKCSKEEHKMINDHPQKEIIKEHRILEKKGLQIEVESIISPKAENESKNTILNEKVFTEERNVVDDSSENEVVQNQKESGKLDLQTEVEQKISQEPEKESKILVAIEKAVSTGIELPTTTIADNPKTADENVNRTKTKPYTYEMDQDFDISQSQLIEIESAFLQESNRPAVSHAEPRAAEIAPALAAAKCGEARMPAFAVPNLPAMPTLNWKKKLQGDRQKLRAAIHEISRLNAMLMTVRREVWPAPGINPDAPPPSDNPRPVHGPGPRRY